MKTIKYLLPILLVALYSCSSEDNGTDATGVFEATEIIVSAESSGKLLSFSIQEGDELIKDQPLGQIDSTQLYLNKLQVKANQVALLSSRVPERLPAFSHLAPTPSQLEATHRGENWASCEFAVRFC